jgi:hypothetical protein
MVVARDVDLHENTDSYQRCYSYLTQAIWTTSSQPRDRCVLRLSLPLVPRCATARNLNKAPCPQCMLALLHRVSQRETYLCLSTPIETRPIYVPSAISVLDLQ